MSKITHISGQPQWSSILSSNTYVIADFYADWCGPCKVIAPVFEQLAQQEAKPGRIAFVKVDVDAQQGIARQYGVSAYVKPRSLPSPRITTDCTVPLT